MLISLSFLNKLEDQALLLLRLGMGGLVAYHGYPQFLGGTARWTELGGAVEPLGLTSLPAFWGFMAAASQLFGGAFVALGLGTRICALFIAVTMSVAASTHLLDKGDLVAATPALAFAIAFVVMFILGPGRFSVDAKLS